MQFVLDCWNTWLYVKFYCCLQWWLRHTKSRWRWRGAHRGDALQYYAASYPATSKIWCALYPGCTNLRPTYIPRYKEVNVYNETLHTSVYYISLWYGNKISRALQRQNLIKVQLKNLKCITFRSTYKGFYPIK